jgi:hypothetical protein
LTFEVELISIEKADSASKPAAPAPAAKPAATPAASKTK